MDNYLLIKSQSRNPTLSLSSSNFTILLNDKVMLLGRKQLGLVNFIGYNTLYNIDSSNNKIDFYENLIVMPPATLASGFYNANTLATEIGNALTTASSGYNTYTVTYSTLTNKYTVSAGNNFKLLFSSGKNASVSPWKVMGFSNSNGTSGIDTTLGTSATGNDIVNLTLPLSFYIQINSFGASNFKSTDGDTFTFYVPSVASNGEIIEYRSGGFFEQWINIPSNINVIERINVVLRGRDGKDLNLKGSEFEMVLAIK